MNYKNLVYVVLRISMGFVFLWAFLDKTFGLGFATTAEKAWINGGSPTTGFLLSAAKGPFAEIFHALAGVAVVDWLFMLGLLGVGVALIFNKYITWAAVAGSVMLLLIYLSSALPPENNPLIDDHLIYILVFAVLAIRAKER